ncbi:Acetate kinase [[Actinomadura] parvosata subsp. kistnae]|uniref:Acetate kinase n=2 Tax=Nonomuraea TaxID=83681 RepID=A0A1V0A219_9ACTN|nr:acetate kinase [Nonomuraea sp. ATCC 55076]AQZ64255.1 acetate kinase [Nonomuraea sp. ATCC 55076]SPM00098.1 Acetate kinase [Actinomadura parvosata subsp. kistnae]
MAGHILVLNTGSSSIKYELVDVRTGRRPARGLVERIGERSGRLTHHAGDGPPYEREAAFPGHGEGLDAMLEAFAAAGPELAPVAVGHRVVHGGDRFAEAVLIDDAVIAAIEELAPLAPLHNPVNLTGIRLASKVFPGVPQVAVFDTAFHRTLPPEAYTYAVPREWGVRRFGFHGTSCAYVSRRAAAVLGRDLADLNLIVLHLGNGASATAISGGRSVDTSMGLTPLEGLVMGTRSGDVDPGLAGYLARVRGLDAEHVEDALGHKSGLLALAGTGDMREVRARDGADARLALRIYTRRIRKYVGAFYALLGRVDAIVFTGGVGEHDAATRAESLAGLERLGIAMDAALNEADATGERAVSPPDAEVPVLVVPTDEEWEIARQALALIGG